MGRRSEQDLETAVMCCSAVTGRIWHCPLLAESQKACAWRRGEMLRSKNETRQLGRYMYNFSISQRTRLCSLRGGMLWLSRWIANGERSSFFVPYLCSSWLPTDQTGEEGSITGRYWCVWSMPAFLTIIMLSYISARWRNSFRVWREWDRWPDTKTNGWLLFGNVLQLIYFFK